MTEDEVTGACKPTRRLTAVALLIWAVLAFALPLASLTLNAVSVAGFPFGYWMTAQGVLIFLVVLAFVFTRRAGGGGGPDTQGSSLQFAGETITSAGFIATVGLIAGLGFDGLWFPLGIVAGLALMVIVIAPRLVLYPAGTLMGFMTARYGSVWPCRMAFLIAILASVLILAADIRGAGLAVQGLTGIGLAMAMACAAVVLALVWLARPMLTLPGPRGLAYCALLGVFLAALTALALNQGRLPLPHFGYGWALEDVKLLERKLLEVKLADLNAMRPLAQPFLNLSMLNFAGLVLGLAFGLAALPHLIGRHLMRAAVLPADAPRRAARALALVALFLSGLAAFAVLGRFGVAQLLTAGVKTTDLPASLLTASGLGWVDICGVHSFVPADITAACAKVSGQKGLLRMQDLAFSSDGYLFASSLLAGIPNLLWLGLLAAGLLAAVLSGHAIVAGLIRAETETRPSGFETSDGLDLRPVALAILLLLVALAIAVFDAREIPALASEGLALVASGLFPALVLGLYWRRMTAAGAVAAMIVGFAVTAAYIAGVRFFPVTMFGMTGLLSNAAPGAVRKFADLLALTAAGDGGARAVANAALTKHAAGIANWWGLKPGASALLGVPAGLLAAVLVSLFTRNPLPEAAD